MPFIIIDFSFEKILLVIIVFFAALVNSLGSLICNIISPNFMINKNEDLSNNWEVAIYESIFGGSLFFIIFCISTPMFAYVYVKKIQITIYYLVISFVLIIIFSILLIILKQLFRKKIWLGWKGI
ncbi:hypothetical protein CSC2_45700 [Clostridium zeae]|uniref:Uncharacterized protein n=1 Tax=Clostridium zeae TaxID=2759022 RepID=A0ABQ1EH83_9CLOT|nr:hypothetical protein CSC2_45700 [Clostridium zeae]